MKLIILNLPRDLGEDALGALFKQHGNVESCTVVMDPQTNTSKGFGFVEMADEHAHAAISALNNSLVGKNKIRVKAAN